LLAKVFRNAGAVAVGTAVGQGLVVLATPVLARVYGPAEFGLFALLSSLGDQTNRTFYGKDAAGYEAALRALASGVLDPLPRDRYFFVAGQTHTMLGAPANFSSSDGLALRDWMGQMVNDDAAWTSRKPP
jgi:hypothetical protein